MKNFLKAATIVAFTTVGGLALTIKPNVYRETNLTVENIEKPSAARDLYLKNCARCHGADGKSDNELGRKLDAPDLTANHAQKMKERKIVGVITYGEDEMPAYGKKLSKAEIKSLARYVRSF